MSASTTPSDLFVRPLSDAPGAEVIGLDLGEPVSAELLDFIHRKHLDHHVLVFRDQRITPTQQVELTKRFGLLQILRRKLHRTTIEGDRPF